jgi:hypothetical protein
MHLDGWLLLDSRDWEADWTPGCAVEVPSAFETRGDVRCLPIRVWETPTDFSSRHSVEFVLDVRTRGPDGPLQSSLEAKVKDVAEVGQWLLSVLRRSS